MHDGRRNPITGYSVIIAEHRGDRPQEWAIQQASRADFECPFCEGREGCTPNESLARRPRGSKPNGPGWRVRVVPNKYPVLCPRRGIISPPTGLHAIIIESPRHLASITRLNEVDFAEVVGVYHERLATLRGSFKSAILFKNSGLLGGATLSHLHSQLITSAAMGP